MRQREWSESTLDDSSPVTDELIGRLYHSSRHGVHALVSGLSEGQRATLAAFCYGRAHLREIGLAIAATCDLDALVAEGGRAGSVLFEQSRELPNDDSPPSFTRHIKVSLAPVNFDSPASRAPSPISPDLA
jgi:hypothetical protein